MFRIDGANATDTLPAASDPGPNPDGYFREGNQQQGIDPTRVGAEWLNMVQEEIATVVESNEALDKSDRGQLLAAIQALIASSVVSVPVGMVSQTVAAAAPAGWLLLDGSTMGSAVSGATRASDGYEALYLLLWGAMADGQAPVTGGRGASAAADWAANKPIKLPDARGRSPVGTGQGAGLSNRVNGVTGGEEAHANTADENGPHNHGVTHDAVRLGGIQYGGSGENGGAAATISTDSSGLGDAHNTMHPFLALNFIVKF